MVNRCKVLIIFTRSLAIVVMVATGYTNDFMLHAKDVCSIKWEL